MPADPGGWLCGAAHDIYRSFFIELAFDILDAICLEWLIPLCYPNFK